MKPLPSTTEISIEIRCEKAPLVFSERTAISQIKRVFSSLAEFLFRANSFPHGCYLMTGTGIVPPGSPFTQCGDEIRHHDSAHRAPWINSRSLLNLSGPPRQKVFSPA